MMNWLIKLVLEVIIEKLGGFLVRLFRRERAKQQDQQQNKADREALEKAETKEERDKAASDIIDHF